MKTQPRRKFRFGVVIGALALGACTMSKSCSCVGPIPNGFDESKRHDDFVQARVTRSGLEFMQNNFATLAPKLLPGGMASFDVPPSGCGGSCSTSSPCVCCGSSPPDCVVDFTFDTLKLTPEDASTSPADPAAHTMNLDLMMDLKTDPAGSGIAITISTFFGNVNCDVTVDTFSSDGGGGPLDVNSNLVFTIPGYDMTRIDFQNFMLNNFQTSDYSINGGWACSIASFFRGFFTSTLVSTLQKQAQAAVENQLCEKCPSGTSADCSAVPGVTCNSKNQCMDSSSPSLCVQKLGLEGTIDAGSLLAKLSPGLSATIDAYDVAGGYAQTNMNGLSLGLTGGDYTPMHNPCVPVVAPPTFSPDPPAQSGYFDGATGDLDPAGNPYDMGIGIHVDQLAQLGWAAFDGGAICLDIGSRTSPLLDSDTFAILVPSLGDLLHGDTVPLILALRPQQPPTFKLGLGTFTTDPKTGMHTISDPLVTVSLPQLQIDFYAFIDQRYVRVFTVQADVTLPLALDAAMGTVTPILGDLKKAFQNVTVTNSYLLAESPSDIATKFPAVVSVALPFLSSALKGFPLPSVLGLDLAVNSITSVDKDPSGNYQLMSFFMNLALPGTTAGTVHSSASLAQLVVPPTRQFELLSPATLEAGPTAYLDVSGTSPSGGTLEYHYRIDGGFWSPFSPVSQLVVQDPAFFLQGHHTVEVQGRVAGQPNTLDPDSASVDVLVDTIPPKVWIARDGWDAAAALAPDPDGVIHQPVPPGPQPGDSVIQIVGHDSVSPDDALQYSVAIDGGGFSGWSVDPRVQLPGPIAEHDLAVRARDEAGNVAEIELNGPSFHGSISTSSSGCGSCAVGDHDGAPLSLFALLMLAGLAFLASGRASRRRQGGEARR